MADVYAGIDLGGTTIRTGLVTGDGTSLSRVVVETRADEGYEAGVRRMGDSVRQAVREAGVSQSDVAGICVGAPGTLDRRRGILLFPPNLKGWENTPIAAGLSADLGQPVILENDANAAAWGEFWVGAGREANSIVMLTLGTGVGGGIVLNGRLWHGAHDCGAEIGHMTIKEGGRRCGCGQQGCLEAYASVTSMVGRLVEAFEAGEDTCLADAIREGRTIRGKDVYDAAVAGDCLADRMMRETAYYLGVGIVNICHVINPECVVLTGGMTAAGDRLMQPVRETVKARAFEVPAERTAIVFASLGEDAGYIGAAGRARLACGGTAE